MTENKYIRFAIVGCGRISKRHSELLGDKQIKGEKLSAVCDVDFQKAKKIGDQFGVPCYSDMNDMMRLEEIDVAVVLTPSGLHAENVIEL